MLLLSRYFVLLSPPITQLSGHCCLPALCIFHHRFFPLGQFSYPSLVFTWFWSCQSTWRSCRQTLFAGRFSPWGARGGAAGAPGGGTATCVSAEMLKWGHQCSQVKMGKSLESAPVAFRCLSFDLNPFNFEADL